MEQFFSNGWTIGIGGGVISGFIVFMVTSRIFSRRENKEYQQKIRLANNELLYAIRPLIVEQKLPTIDIFNSILLSTAKKYSVKTSDLYSREDIADDLTKEIMDNPFLTSENKLQYCELTEKVKNLNRKPQVTDEHKTEVIYVEKERAISKEYLSLTMAVMTAMMVVVMSLFLFRDKGLIDFKENISNNKGINWLTIMAMLTTIPVLAMTLTKMLELIKEKEKRRKVKDEGANVETDDNK